MLGDLRLSDVYLMSASLWTRLWLQTLTMASVLEPLVRNDDVPRYGIDLSFVSTVMSPLRFADVP